MSALRIDDEEGMLMYNLDDFGTEFSRKILRVFPIFFVFLDSELVRWVIRGDSCHWYMVSLPASFKLLGFTWQVIRSTPNFVAAKEVYRLRPFTVFRYSLKNDAFVRDFSAPELVGGFYVSAVGEYTHRSSAMRSLKTLEDQLQSYRKFFGN